MHALHSIYENLKNISRIGKNFKFDDVITRMLDFYQYPDEYKSELWT